MYSMAEFDWMALTVRLGREFKRRAMTAQVKALREFYARRAQERKANAARGRPLWDEDVVLDWLAIFRIPPFERVYTVRPPNAPCPKCRASPRGHEGPNWNCTPFPGGELIECLGCGQRWLTAG
jgi:hypothetical protein